MKSSLLHCAFCIANCALDLNDRRHDHRLGADFFLNKSFQKDTQVFLKEVAVNDMFAFHIADGGADG